MMVTKQIRASPTTRLAWIDRLMINPAGETARMVDGTTTALVITGERKIVEGHWAFAGGNA